MNDAQEDRLSELLDELSELRDDVEKSDGYWLSFDRKCSESDAHLEGNSTGLLQMAGQLLGLALRDSEGAHAHFDEFSNFGQGDDSLIVWKHKD